MKREPKIDVWHGAKSYSPTGDPTPEWYWHLKAANGQIVADSAEGYSTRSGAVRAARRMVGLVLQIAGHAEPATPNPMTAMLGWKGPFTDWPPDVPTGSEIRIEPDGTKWYRPVPS